MIENKIQEELRKKFNPDGSDLREMQMKMLEILIYFDNFCKSHGIKYWLSSGTLLGAIRHKGFIPWDDDMDIEMLEGDYKKLCSYRNEFENEDFVLQDFFSDKEYISPSPKLRYKKSKIKEKHDRDLGYKYDGFFIDIFIRQPSFFLTSRIAHIFQYVSYTITSIRRKKLRHFLKQVCYYVLNYFLFIPLRLIDNIFADNNYYMYRLGSGFYDKISKDTIFPLRQVEFENYIFPGPNNSDAYLSTLYGDYKIIPDSNNIKSHLLKNE